ncbi:hypothetical protein [Absidia glauca]|uniref:Uncharacterized protein n=1 Tax=Absidia glauca TaxID=4829 RepID=A0A168KQE3_ABSGL|nr:hypothetical protein [Absidia glauca]
MAPATAPDSCAEGLHLELDVHLSLDYREHTNEDAIKLLIDHIEGCDDYRYYSVHIGKPSRAWCVHFEAVCCQDTVVDTLKTRSYNDATNEFRTIPARVEFMVLSTDDMNGFTLKLVMRFVILDLMTSTTPSLLHQSRQKSNDSLPARSRLED